MTRNGKLDRAALPAPDYGAGAGAGRGPVGAGGGLVRRVRRGPRGLARVGVDDDFFALGGHSLLAVRLVERLRVRGVRVDVRTLFNAPSPARLAAAAGAGGRGAADRIPAGAGRSPRGCCRWRR